MPGRCCRRRRFAHRAVGACMRRWAARLRISTSRCRSTPTGLLRQWTASCATSSPARLLTGAVPDREQAPQPARSRHHRCRMGSGDGSVPADGHWHSCQLQDAQFTTVPLHRSAPFQAGRVARSFRLFARSRRGCRFRLPAKAQAAPCPTACDFGRQAPAPGAPGRSDDLRTAATANASRNATSDRVQAIVKCPGKLSHLLCASTAKLFHLKRNFTNQSTKRGTPSASGVAGR